MIMRNIEGNGGFIIGGTVINNLRYADDTVIITETEEELQQLIEQLYRNGSKSFTMVFQSLQSYLHVTSQYTAPA